MDRAGSGGSGRSGGTRSGGPVLGPFLPGQHPVDDLIRALIAAPQRPVTAQEIAQIQWHIATAPHNLNDIKIRAKYRGITYQGMTLGRREPSLRAHLAIRVVYDGQWVDGTTAQQYVADLHAAVQQETARIVVYERGGTAMAAVLAPHTIPVARQGPQAEDTVFVVYAADNGFLVSAYQTAGVAKLDISQEARWIP